MFSAIKNTLVMSWSVVQIHPEAKAKVAQLVEHVKYIQTWLSVLG